MPLNFTTTQEAAKVNGVKCITYSDSGMGKTLICATAPAPLILSAESGLLSLSPDNIARVYGVNTPGISYNLNVLQITSLQDLDDAYNWIAYSNESAGFLTICLDSITEIAERILSSAKPEVKDPRQAYGLLVERMENRVKLFRDLPGRHVYMASKMEMNKDELSGAMKYGPSMPGKQLGPALPYYFDEVFRLGVNKDAEGNLFRFLQTAPDLQFVAKDRSGALAAIEYPHLGNIFNKILSGGM